MRVLEIEPPERFKPVAFVCETEEELKLLWAMADTRPSDMDACHSCIGLDNSDSGLIYDMWSKVDDECVKRGLKPKIGRFYTGYKGGE
jgi:hypothetical protein